MRRWRGLRHFRGRDGERGQAALELALILPAFFILLFLCAEGSAALKTWLVLENASREGARAAAVRKSSADVVSITVARSGGAITAGEVAVTNAFCGLGCGQPGQEAQVTITHTYTFKSPLAALVNAFSGGSIDTTIPMTAHTSMRIE